jgi:hypothetical protein
MAPSLLFGFGIAGALSVMLPSSFVEKHLGKNKISSVFKATLAGVPLPLCSCGVIPVAASLRERGASKGATTAFLISTPQTGVDSITVTYALMGPVFTLFRLGAAIASGIAGGIIVTATSDEENENVSNHLKTDSFDPPVSMTIKEKVAKAITYGFITLPSDIGGSLIIGIIIAGAISTFIPPDFFLALGGNTFFAMIAMLLLGIPMYVCATASVPVAAALITKGISPGAALVFLMTGPATNAAAISAIHSMMGRRCTIAFLSSVAGTSLIAGYILNTFMPKITAITIQTGHSMASGVTEELCAIALILIIAFALYKKRSNHLTGSKNCCSVSHNHSPGPELHLEDDCFKEAEASEEEEVLYLKVDNITCSHCVKLVEETILATNGVTFVDITQSTGMAKIRGFCLSSAEIAEHLQHVGHQAIKIAEDS